MQDVLEIEKKLGTNFEQGSTPTFKAHYKII